MRLSVRSFGLSATVAVLVALAGTAQAAWPERPVTMIVPFTAGGITDVLARAIGEELQTALKQPFVVENLPGGAGVVAAEHVLRAEPDGYTLFFTPIFQVTMAPFTHTVAFDPAKDFKPIGPVGSSPFVITIRADIPASNLGEFIAYVKARPGEVTYGTAGPGSLTHVSSAVFAKSAGLDMVHVPYKGLGQAFPDLLAGRIAMLSASPVEIKPYLSSGKIRPLAATGSVRSRQMPDVPLVADTLPSPPVVTVNGLLASARVPDEVVDTLSRAILAAEATQEFRDRIDRIGAEPLAKTPGEFAKIIADDTNLWRDIVRDLKLKTE